MGALFRLVAKFVGVLVLALAAQSAIDDQGLEPVLAYSRAIHGMIDLTAHST